jgi:hypothetical protein
MQQQENDAATAVYSARGKHAEAFQDAIRHNGTRKC